MTGLILRALGAPVEEAAQVVKASLAFRGGVSAGWVGLWLLVLGVGVYWIYRKSPGKISLPARLAMTGLRILFLGLLLALLLQPVLSLTVEGSVRRILIVLLDASASMRIEDPRREAADQKRAALARGLLSARRGLEQELEGVSAKSLGPLQRLEVMKSAFRNEELDLLPRLEKEFDLAVFTFGQEVTEISAGRRAAASTNGLPRGRRMRVDKFPWVDRLEAGSPGTAIGDALREVLRRKRGQPLAGVWLVSDGANNSGSQPLEAAGWLRRQGVPLYIYGVGTTSPRDIIVANLFGPEVTFVQDEATVMVRVHSRNLAGETGEVVLKLGGEEVARQRLDLAEDGEQVVPMRFQPQAEGEFELEASIKARPDEAVTDNNRRAQRLRVVDKKIQVLLVEQAPRWEFRYLQAMFLRDRRIDLKCYLVEGDPGISRGPQSPYVAGFPAQKETLFAYDVVILGDVDPKRLSGSNLEHLREWVSKFGGALVVMAGRRWCPQAYRRGILEQMLPVEIDVRAGEGGEGGRGEKPIWLSLTAAGKEHPMLQLVDDPGENERLWRRLPPVYWVARATRPKPAAEVLVVDPDPAKETRFGKMPVVALQQYGLGQVLYVGTDNLWRWRKNGGDRYHAAVWAQMVQRVSLARLLGVSKRTQLSTDRQNYVTGDRVTVYARLYSTGYEPVEESMVKGFYRLQNSQGPRAEVTLRAIPGQAGLYRGEFVAPAPGGYRFLVESDLESGLDFSVSEPQFEFGQTAMNEGLLRELAGAGRGAFFREEDLYQLPEAIRARTERVRLPVEVRLWSSPFCFLLLLLVVTAEWMMRKRCYLK